ncbi:hypothetical protein [Lysinibacillus sp. 3P01SB]|uniref:hypothetical protein n=1 Tax=Lysinibacillus sp. 3P01SB TaxID=3132284 RepID=UPI0039A6FF81
MGRKNNNSNSDSLEPSINKEVVAVDLAILSSIIAMLSQAIGTFSLFLQAESIQEAEEAEAAGSANNGSDGRNSNYEISPERFRKLEKQVQYLTKEIERLKG